ncbi:hypothetical protein ACXR8F_17770 [Terrabacter sp. AAH1]
MSVLPRVLALGSCRVFRPLHRLHSAGKLDLLYYARSPHWWFTHSAGEAIQYLEALRGEVEIPTPLRPLICETTADLPDDLSDDARFGSPDVAVLEISTLKAFHSNRLRLNMQRVWGYAHASSVNAAAVLAGQKVNWPHDRRLIADLDVRRESAEVVADQIRQIRELVGVPLLTVDHLFATTTNGDPIPGRSQITALLGDVSDGDSIALHSTRPLIEQHGESIALQDATHYAADFEPLAGDAMWTSIERLLERSSSSIR